jgi:uncharacterized membrane protein YccC
VTQLAEVFEIKRQGFNLRRGVGVAAVMLLPLIVLAVLHQEKYFLSVAFAALFVGLSDPGGEYGYRVPRMALVAIVGALLTVLGFAIGDRPWGLVVLAAFVITVLAGLAVKYGLHSFAAALLLNVWFLIALDLPGAYRLDHVHTSAWAQALAWLIGSALAIAYTGIIWLARGRAAQPQPGADVLPGDITPIKLTRPVILFVLIRAIAVSAAVAIAFGLHLPSADWMPVATMVAMKPSLAQSTLIAEQRLAGAIIGAAVAALFLLTIDNKTGLEVVIVILGALAGAARAVNYALYCAAVAGAVLIAMDLPHPSNLADEGRRVLFTFIGVGIAVVVMLLANLLQNRTAKPAPQTPQAGTA